MRQRRTYAATSVKITGIHGKTCLCSVCVDCLDFSLDMPFSFSVGFNGDDFPFLFLIVSGVCIFAGWVPCSLTISDRGDASHELPIHHFRISDYARLADIVYTNPFRSFCRDKSIRNTCAQLFISGILRKGGVRLNSI
jgi:hypothetical protein